MKIKSLKYNDKVRKWRVNRIVFNDLTLLVGASGVGKTQILRAIHKIIRVSQGEPLNGIQWEIGFEANNNSFEWEGEFENLDVEEENPFPAIFRDDERIPAKIIYERIKQNGKEIVRRDENHIYFKGDKTIKLAQHKSVVDLIIDEPLISIKEALQLITLNDYTNIDLFGFSTKDLEIEPAEYSDLQSIRRSDESILSKLYLCTLVAPQIVEEIKQKFIEIFPFVLDIKIQLIPEGPRKIPKFFHDLPMIYLKEKGVNDWIHQSQLSSGMHRVLFQLGELHLCADGTVFLIDEFENSLGINCIDDLTSTLITYERDLQFIITSHHPYIINSIPFTNWKIVTRQGGVVSAKNATDYNLGKSKHKAFTQLINLDAYNEGVEE